VGVDAIGGVINILFPTAHFKDPDWQSGAVVDNCYAMLLLRLMIHHMFASCTTPHVVHQIEHVSHVL
jgi:hypothetical protein